MKSKLKILVVFVVMFCASFIPESNHELFGDWNCKGGVTIVNEHNTDVKGCNYGAYMTHNPTWHWGIRHWLWLLAGVTFSIWTIVDVIIEIEKKAK
jgi:hypothetical protein